MTSNVPTYLFLLICDCNQGECTAQLVSEWVCHSAWSTKVGVGRASTSPVGDAPGTNVGVLVHPHNKQGHHMLFLLKCQCNRGLAVARLVSEWVCHSTWSTKIGVGRALTSPLGAPGTNVGVLVHPHNKQGPHPLFLLKGQCN